MPFCFTQTTNMKLYNYYLFNQCLYSMHSSQFQYLFLQKKVIVKFNLNYIFVHGRHAMQIERTNVFFESTIFRIVKLFNLSESTSVCA